MKILFLIFVVTVTHQSVSSELLGRGAACAKNQRFSPKFRANYDQCDGSKGLSCIESENPDYVSKDSRPATICECTEEYYFDPVSQECRIQVGLPCDPESQTSWSNKCPENSFCSRDVGRYGPKNAKGMCRCQNGYYVSSVWYVGGGGTVCEKDQDNEKLFRKDGIILGAQYDDLEMNGLVMEQ